ncbi:MAG: Nucleotidyltransferase [Microgenomates group bacterium GW2011_GWA2_40_6]|nr:MAG: Nucleotidyltransferase [Microgenomates group bacterium GW2011_GWA2_40_6]
MTMQDISAKIIPVLKSQGVIKAAFFGSVSRGEAKQNSDIDILVDFGEKKSLLDFVGLQLDLEEILHQKVDLLTYNSINPLLRDIILKDQKVIYG